MSHEHAAAILRAAMNKDQTVIINGKNCRIKLLRANLWRLAQQAVAGDRAAGKFIDLVVNGEAGGDRHG